MVSVYQTQHACTLVSVPNPTSTQMPCAEKCPIPSCLEHIVGACFWLHSIYWLLLYIINRIEPFAMTTPPCHIPPLTATNFSDWHVACVAAAKQVLPTNGPLGGLGLLLPPEEYSVLNHGEAYTAATKQTSITLKCHPPAECVDHHHHVIWLLTILRIINSGGPS